MYVAEFWCERQQEMDFSTGGQKFEVKNILTLDLFLTNWQLLASQDVNWWTGVVWITCGLLWCFYQLHSDGTHSLQRIHCWASDGMLHFSKSDEETNSTTTWKTIFLAHYDKFLKKNGHKRVKGFHTVRV